MMRKRRCTKCKSNFLTSDPAITECQHCTGDLPDKAEAEELREKLVAEANSAVKTDRSQIVSMDTLTKKTDEATATKPKRTARKSKDTDDTT